MDELEKIVKYNSLFLLYGELLSSTQKEVLTSYYGYNLSISEIASERNISRAAVEDAIKKGEKKLDELENILHIASKKELLLNNICSLKKVIKDKETLKIINEMERSIK